jgi:hypothetical protein
VKIYNFDLLAYPHVPKEAPRTPVPSNYFDPVKGTANYNEHLEEMAYCEELGFNGVVFNEHHYSAYGTMPSPNLIAAALSQKTTRIKIGVLGNILPLRNHPVRVAEEYAMIDCLSNGRLIAGFVRGIPPEYIWYGVNPEESRGRFEEAYDLIMTAWTQPVWSHEGKFFQLKDCAIWPRPMQQPHPPIWIAARSAESIEWCVTCRRLRSTRQPAKSRTPSVTTEKSLATKVGKPPQMISFCAVTSTLMSPIKKRKRSLSRRCATFSPSSIAASTKRSTRMRSLNG